MKRNFKQKIMISAIILMILLSFGKIYAVSKIGPNAKEAEYTEEYKQYLELSEEEKQKVLEPNKYKVITDQSNSKYLEGLNNAFRINKLLKNALSPEYTLQTVIPENMKIKNQGQTNTCWAFATIAALESNLAVQDKQSGKAATGYDFSEKHMAYGITRYAFLNGAKNTYGMNRKVSDGGNFLLASTYLTNGSGAVLEKDVPFVNSEENIDISQIKNKTVSTTVENTKIFSTPSTEAEKQEIKNEMKQYITNYGGIYAGVHGAQILSECYNNKTGALYCDSHKIDHAVMIVGWDDNYNKANFKKQPANNGAWIIKNSWGEKQTESLQELKNSIYTKNTAQCNERGWNSASEIPDEFIITNLESTYGEGKVTKDGDNINVELGNKGYMYVSYEDKNIYSELYGIEKASPKKNYYNLYQNDELGYSNIIQFNGINHIYIANVFERNANVKEVLDKISIYTFQEYTCKVYVNPNGKNKALGNLQTVALKQGNSITIQPGYRTLEFANPIELIGDSFVVVVELTTNQNYSLVPVECKSTTGWEEAVVNTKESYIASVEEAKNDNTWEDLALLTTESLRGNACIKAFTKEKTEETTLNSISITKAPTKTTYTEGENFDKAGMKVVAKYSDNSEKEITNYTIIGGDNLTTDKTNVTISYTEGGITKQTTQEITVSKAGTNPPQVNPSDEEKEPVSSNFKKSVATVTNIESYFYTDKTKGSYSKIKMKISNIQLGDIDNTYTYYYYLSGTQGDKNISDWKNVKANKEEDGTYSIVIDVDTRNIKNSDQIAESDNLFIYIKEIAQINNKTKELITTMNVKNSANANIYLDNKKVGSLEEAVNKINTSSGTKQDTKADNTVASGKIPQTGIGQIIICIIMGVGIIGIIAYCKFKNIDK